MIAHEAVKRGGVGGEVAAIVTEQAFASLRAPIVRVAAYNTVIPFNLTFERAAVPQVADIIAGARSVLGILGGTPEMPAHVASG